MASKKTTEPKKTKIKESNPVVPVIFRRTIGGYPPRGSFGYLDADLFESWKEKGHVVSAVDKAKKVAKVVVVKAEEKKDEVDTKGKSSTTGPDAYTPIYGATTTGYRTSNS